MPISEAMLGVSFAPEEEGPNNFAAGSHEVQDSGVTCRNILLPD